MACRLEKDNAWAHPRLIYKNLEMLSLKPKVEVKERVP